MERDVFEVLAEYALQGHIDASEKPVGSWFALSDNVTNIKNREMSKSHPCLIFGLESARTGLLHVWIRSKSHFDFERDQLPFSLTHKAHQHQLKKTCPCSSDASVIIRHLKKVPVSIILRQAPQCFETDQSWLRIFSACVEKVHGRPLLQIETKS